MSYDEQLSKIKFINQEFRHYKTIESIFELDQWSALPAKGGFYRQQVATFITTQKTQLFKTPEATALAAYFEQAGPDAGRDYIERGLIRSFLFRYRSIGRAPEDKLKAYSMLRADTMNKWKESREKQDYNIFKPYLKQVFTLKKEIAEAICPDSPAFDTLVGMTDEGLSCDEVSREFEKLKVGIGDLLKRINQSSCKIDNSFLKLAQDESKMTAFGKKLVSDFGYDEQQGGFNDRVVHAFTSFMGPKDARVSTYRGNTMHMLFTYLHESGHAMYAYGGNDLVNAANMWGGIEGGFHESQARFYENMIGRSKSYWSHYYPALQKEFSTFANVDLDDFYRAINCVQPSLKRTTADEVTYSLHSIIRFELERDWFSGKLTVDDLPFAWNDKYQQYLGIRPDNDTEGILQDMHWAGDYIGYFQSYALGNIYDGQILEVMLRSIPDLDVRIANADYAPISEWLTEKISQYGCCFTARELIKNITGKTLDAAPFIRYLDNKYSDIYRFNSKSTLFSAVLPH
jgi:carboxypeptidase Taq